MRESDEKLEVIAGFIYPILGTVIPKVGQGRGLQGFPAGACHRIAVRVV